MPYFPKEDTEEIRLATVVYETDEDGAVVMAAGRPKVKQRTETGETLNIVRKDAPVGVRRVFYTQLQAAQSREKRIANQRVKLEDPNLPQAEYDAIEANIAEQSDKPSSFELMCKFVADGLRSWDYYATKADYEARSPIPLTVEAIRDQCDADILSQVIDHLNNRTEQESAEGKEQPAVLPNGSSPKEALETAQTSTATMQ